MNAVVPWDGMSVSEALLQLENLRQEGRCSLWLGDDLAAPDGATWERDARALAVSVGYSPLVEAIEQARQKRDRMLPVQRAEDPEVELLAQSLEVRGWEFQKAWMREPLGSVRILDPRYRAVLTDSVYILAWQGARESAETILAPDVPPPQTFADKAVVCPFRRGASRVNMVLSMTRFAELLRAAPEYHRSLRSLMTSAVVVYVGVAPRTLVALLSAIEVTADPSMQHVAFVDRRRMTSLADLEALRWKHNVLVVVHEPSEFREIVDDLLSAPEPHGVVLESVDTSPPVISSLELENVGLHRALSLRLAPSWNVLLGENGTGKTSILRAIAITMLGEDVNANVAATNLLRAQTTNGQIVVETSGSSRARYTSLLNAESSGVRVIARQRTPLEEKRLLVLGFPAVRGVSTRLLAGPRGFESGPPSALDVLPLALGDVDPRIDDVRQWVVNRWAEAQAARAGDHTDRTAIIRQYFETLSQMTPGTPWSFARVDSAKWSVLVDTEDGEVPLERLSQGIVSIVGWVGTLLYRLYDAFPDSDDPAKERALVLIDEIDAHLHPEWQRKLVPLMKLHFPNLQVIAATHSPLMVTSLSKGEVKVLVRTERGVIVKDLSEDPGLLRVDQVLTSDAFGLDTTLSERALQMRDEHAALVGIPPERLTSAQRERIEEIEDAWPSAFESEKQRTESQQLVRDIVEQLAQKGAKVPAVKKATE
ncbi:MAG: AAA family ATPase [Myxococcales bacterium]|nr:AAA family ATPase [Myxococcales bacterium]